MGPEVGYRIKVVETVADKTYTPQGGYPLSGWFDLGPGYPTKEMAKRTIERDIAERRARSPVETYYIPYKEAV